MQSPSGGGYYGLFRCVRVVGQFTTAPSRLALRFHQLDLDRPSQTGLLKSARLGIPACILRIESGLCRIS
jgi:hypothetical protein